jgi:Zn-dependent protease with chaperone function
VTLAARGADVIVLDAAFNASWSVVGVRRRRVLTLGLPLVAVLEPQELVALIGHEVGHERNGDLTHLWIVDSSLHGLGAIADALTPHPGEGRYEFGPLASIVNALMLVLGLPARGLLRAQLALVLRDSRRAEYLADHLAAQVAGSDAEISGEEKLLLAGVLDATLQRHDFGPRVDGREAIALLRSAVRDVPERERERRRRVARMEGVRAGATHPPTGRRIEVVQRRPPQRAAIVLDGVRAAAVARELSAHEGELGRELVERWRDGWRLAA